MGHLSFLCFIVNVTNKVIDALFETTPYRLPFKIYTNKLDLKSLKVLILASFNFFQFEAMSYHLAGLVVYFNFRNCRFLYFLRKSINLMQKILYPILIDLKSKFLCRKDSISFTMTFFYGLKCIFWLSEFEGCWAQKRKFCQMGSKALNMSRNVKKCCKKFKKIDGLWSKTASLFYNFDPNLNKNLCKLLQKSKKTFSTEASV